MTIANFAGVVACVGEPLVCFSSPPERSLLDSGQAEVSEGGAELNVAIHLARLGTRVRLAGAVGDDVLGRRVVARLRREGVDVTALQLRAGERTGAYVKEWAGARREVVYLRAGSAASRLISLPPSALDGVTHVHISGITAALSPDCEQLVRALLMRPRSYTASFDVNYRDKLWPVGHAAPRLRQLSGLADVVFVGRDEAEQLWSTSTPADVHRLLAPAGELVVKDDARPATVWSGDDREGLAPVAAEVTEPVGAGDAFAAGYLFGRARGCPPRASLAVGHRLARAALEAIDDVGGPVAAAEIERLLEEPV